MQIFFSTQAEGTFPSETPAAFDLCDLSKLKVGKEDAELRKQSIAPLPVQPEPVQRGFAKPFSPFRIYTAAAISDLSSPAGTSSRLGRQVPRGTPFHNSAANLRRISRPGPVGLTVSGCHQIWASEGPAM